MTTTLPAPGVARPMSGAPSNEEFDPIQLASWYEISPPLDRDGRQIAHVIVTSGGIWECDARGHLTGFGRLLSKRHGINTPAEDLVRLGYGAWA